MGLSVLRLYERRLRAPNLKTCKLKAQSHKNLYKPPQVFSPTGSHACRTRCERRATRSGTSSEFWRIAWAALKS